MALARLPRHRRSDAARGKAESGQVTLALAVCNGESAFLGHSIDSGPVVYVSEEGAGTLAHKVAGDRLRIATRESAWPRLSPRRSEAERVSAALVIVNTFAFWAALGPESEKDAGVLQAAMEPLHAIAHAAHALLLVAHSCKSGGEDGDSVRGSSARRRCGHRA